MLRMEEELNNLQIHSSQRSTPQQPTAQPTVPGDSSKVVDYEGDSPVSPGGMQIGYRGDANKNHWLDGFIGCFRPVLTIIGKKPPAVANDWEIPFEEISDLQWLGSGAQGAVFRGILKGEWVAVKKVREKKETDVLQLQKLNHPNIVKAL